MIHNGWEHQFEFPEMVVNGLSARPQGIHVLPDGNLLITAHFNDQFSRAYKVTTSGSVLGWFQFPDLYRHIASVSAGPDGVYFADYTTGHVICMTEYDLASSLAIQLAVYDPPNPVATAGVLSGLQWINDDHNEWWLIAAEYRTSGTPYMWCIGENRLKRMTITQRLQGIAWDGTHLHIVSNRLTSGSTVGTHQVIDLGAFLANEEFADSWIAYLVGSNQLTPGNYPEDLAFDASGALWTLTEGNTSVGTPTNYLAAWRKVL